MPRETRQARIGRAAQITALLKAAYPGARCELDYSTPIELLIATILSAQSTDKQVNIVTRSLFRKYRQALDYARAPIQELEEDLRSLGLFRNKARHIRACCAELLRGHRGEVPARMEELVRLPGVGRKTANVVLGNAFEINEGVVVDTHVARLSQRLGFTRETLPGKIEADLQRLIPQNEWALFSHLLIWHGRRRCFARKPACAECVLNKLCPSAEFVDQN